MGVLTIEFLSGMALGTIAATAGPASVALAHRRRARRALAEVGRLRRSVARTTAESMRLARGNGERARAEAATAAKSRALATVSHEIRTPLGGILGVADLLARTPLTPEQQSYVAAVKTSGGALMTLVDDVLDLSRIEAGRNELAAEAFDPVTLVESVVELLASRAHDKGLDIASFVAGDVPTRLVGDPHRLRQVLLNLAGNAVKFTDDGGVGVVLGRCADGRVVFGVSDTGPGISPAHRAAIFTEFERADAATASAGEGIGLGLAIVERLVADMGGELGFAERAGGGALFAVRLALPAAAAEDAEPASLGGPGTEHRSLVVSPGPYQAAYLEGALRDQCGGEVFRVRSSLEALALLQKTRAVFDAVFIDCALGDEEARTVAAVARLNGARKIVLMFSPQERRQLRQPLTTGFDEWLVKPIRRASLAGRLAPLEPARADRDGRDGPPKVLLAEDDPVNALIARAALERLGTEVVHVSDGESAWRAFEAALDRDQRPFDLALMDLSMPLLDGVAAAHRIRALEQAYARRPMRIVATTAHAFLDTHRACEEAGMDEVLTKPIDPARLKRLLARLPGAVAPAERLDQSA